MANKKKYTNEQIADALKKGLGQVSQAAKVLKCDQQTIYRRIASSPELKQIQDDFDEENVDLGVIALRSMIIDKNPWAVGFILKTKGAKRGYVEQRNINIGGQPEAPPIRIRFAEKEQIADFLTPDLNDGNESD